MESQGPCRTKVICQDPPLGCRRVASIRCIGAWMADRSHAPDAQKRRSLELEPSVKRAG